jgi:SNF2 family DNA or RNA helicase
MVKVGRLRELACGDFFFGGEHSSKTKTLLELLDMLGEEKVIIFTEYARTADFLQKNIPGSLVIQGSTPTAERNKIIEKWKNSGRILIGTSALATGVNLQDAHYVIQFDLPWTKAEEDQRISRSHRTGQKNPVTVYNLMAKNTIDQHIRYILNKKGNYMAELIAWTKEKEPLL